MQFRFCQLVFGLTPNPAIQYHLTRYLLTEPNIVKLLVESFYVDDFTCGAQIVDEGFMIFKELRNWYNVEGLISRPIQQFYNKELLKWSKRKVLV